MKFFYNKILIVVLIIFVNFQCQKLHATKRNADELENLEQPPSAKRVKISESIPDIFPKNVQNILQKLKNSQYVSDLEIRKSKETDTKELEKFELILKPDHDLFDHWTTFILRAFSKDSSFTDHLILAKERGESETATPIAQYNLGMMYHFGQGIDKNIDKAIEWYQKAANHENAYAQYSLGDMYYSGNDIGKDWKKAFELYEKAAYQENADAQYSLGYMYQKGQGIDKNIDKAIQWYQKAAEQGNADAQFNLGNIYQHTKEVKSIDKAIQWYQKAAEQEHAKAQYSLGDMYYFGNDIGEDLKKAFELYEKAANQKNAYAQYSLGYMYQKGQGIDKNIDKAIEWYQKAANQGHVNAQNDLGDIYYSGNDIGKDLKKAFELYEKAAYQENADAQYRLGHMYQQGQGVNKNVDKAIEWYQKAAERKNVDASCTLGNIYNLGLDVKQDLVQSFKWYLKSFKDKNTHPNLKDSIKNLVTFIPLKVLSKDEDETNLMNNLKTLKENIEVYIGHHESKKVGNQSNLPDKGRKSAIPSLYEPYQKIVDFEQTVLNIINRYNQPGFMVTCLRSKNTNAFKLSSCSDIKYYEFQNQFYLTFGKENIKAADELIDIISNVTEIQTQHKAISKILGIQTRIQKDYLCEALKLQDKIRLDSLSEYKILKATKRLSDQNQLLENIEFDIERLVQLQLIPKLLEEWLIESAPYRNKLFLQKEDYIESIFKN